MKIITISSKGQITLPRSLMRELGLKPKSKVYIRKEENEVVVEPVSDSIIDELAGSLNKYIDPKKLGKPFSEIMEETKKKTALEIVRKWQK